jgi:homoserine dehydrogenase
LLWKIGIVGFGNVGQGLAHILNRKKEILKRRYDFEYIMTFIADPVRGSLYNENGLDLDSVLKEMALKGSLKNRPEFTDKGTLELIEMAKADIVAEATITNFETGEPGLSHMRKALSIGSHVVTSNKGPIALALEELESIAKENRVCLRYEGVVLSGTPCINMVLECMSGCDIKSVAGIVNGTTNFILSKMEEGYDYPEALVEAQKLGYAETDPTSDVEGWDSAIKAAIMANVFFGAKIKVTGVVRQGITKITKEDIVEANKEGKRIKLIAEVRKEGNGVYASVSPVAVPKSHVLGSVMGPINAVTFATDHLGEVTIIGPGAGRIETGQALLSDILAIHRCYVCK